MFKKAVLAATLVAGSAAMATEYRMGTEYIFQKGLIYCDEAAIENQVEILSAGIGKRVTGCYESTSESSMKLLRNYPDRGFSKWIMIFGDIYYTTYLPNSLIE